MLRALLLRYAAIAVLTVAGGTMVAAGSATRRPPSPAARASAASYTPVAVEAARPLVRSVPVRLSIPAIGVDTKVISVGLHRDGTVAVPPLRSNAPAGWYDGLATPGENGTAVILGHVDSADDGPAVFYRLGALRPGAAVYVRRADATTAAFVVTAVAQYPKTSFPATAVYGPVAYPALRLITCGGSFDRRRGTYLSNTVVYARLRAAV